MLASLLILSGGSLAGVFDACEPLTTFVANRMAQMPGGSAMDAGMGELCDWIGETGFFPPDDSCTQLEDSGCEWNGGNDMSMPSSTRASGALPLRRPRTQCRPCVWRGRSLQWL